MLLGGLLLATAALAGCTATGAPSPSPTASASDVTGLPKGVQQATDVPTDVVNTPALRGSVEITECSAADGGWKAEGTAKNTGDAAKTYTITVFFTTDHGTVIGTGDTKVDVEPGKTEDWTVAAKLTPAPKTLCVLRGVG
jgi:hypothetical protein